MDLCETSQFQAPGGLSSSALFPKSSLSCLLPLPPPVRLALPNKLFFISTPAGHVPPKGLSPAGQTSLPAREAHQLLSTNADISGLGPVSFFLFSFFPCILSKSLIFFSYSLIALSQSPSVTEA